MSLRFHEICEKSHRILNPFTEDKLMLLGEVCDLGAGMQQLDLACGKGELLCRWAERHGIQGTGVDISRVFLGEARERAEELGVANHVSLVHGNAGEYPRDDHAFDIVSCIGATWIGNGLTGTLRLMRRALRDNSGLLLVGEPYWIDPPPEQAVAALGETKDVFTSLGGTLDRLEQLDLELVEMVLANQDSWDRYEASQWRTASNWLRDNPDDPEAEAFREWVSRNRRSYLQYGRRYFGWGVFVLRPVE
jgi:cyclopropane fatty-acyl-phospholipid synthase-like methyltransferase